MLVQDPVLTLSLLGWQDLLQMAGKIPQTLKTLSMQYNGQLEENGLVAMFTRQTALTDINLTGPCRPEHIPRA